MNRKGNQRYQDTRERIVEVFQKLLREKRINEITVSEICRLSGVHRTTFYGHFEDIYALLDDQVREMYKQIIPFFVQEEKVELGDGFLQMFEYIRENQDFFYGFMENCYESIQMNEVLPELLRENIESIVQIMGFFSEEELLYHQTFFTAGLMAVIRRWILRGCTESPQQMAQLIAKEYTPNRAFFSN